MTNDNLAMETSAQTADDSPITLAAVLPSQTLSGSKFFCAGDLVLSDSDDDTLKEVSDIESMASGPDASVSGDRAKFLRPRKRTAAIKSESSDSSKSSASKASKASKAKRRPGRPPTSGDYVALAETRTQAARALRDLTQAELEAQVSEDERQLRKIRAKSGYGVSNILDYSNLSVADLVSTAKTDAEQIIGLSLKSGNIKGTIQKSFKNHACSFLALLEEMGKRTTSDETAALQATVTRLSEELVKVREELAIMRADQAVAAVQKATPKTTGKKAASICEADLLAQMDVRMEHLLAKKSAEDRFFVRALIEGIEGRLLPEVRVRPPLAADKKGLATETTPVPEALNSPPPPPKGKGKGVGKKTKVPDAAPSTSKAPLVVSVAPASMEEDVLLPSTTPANDGWNKVVGRKTRRVQKAQAAAAAAITTASSSGSGLGLPPKGKRPRNKKSAQASLDSNKPAAKKKLVSPRSAAVVISLTAEAIQKGETYETVLKRARGEIGDAAALGVAPRRCRKTRVGSLLFEFPGAQRDSQADTFAERLRQVVSGAANVLRPVKTASLQVADLDYSVTKEEVAAKVAEIGGCAVDSIKVGEIRSGRGGVGTLRLQCPVTAAKAVLSRRRFLVGWSSASVSALEERPLRCFKCMGIGHTSMYCPSSEDRTQLCFRCGMEGHKVAGCTAKPRCAVCADSGRPAGHVMRGKDCNPPPKKGKLLVPTQAPVADAAGPSVARDGAMSE